jgi:hypothetical protein
MTRPQALEASGYECLDRPVIRLDTAGMLQGRRPGRLTPRESPAMR